MSLIAISYRREDSPGTAGRIYDYLTSHIDKKHVFIDEDINLGAIFTTRLDDVFTTCKVLLVVIGRDWVIDRENKKRLDDPEDYVRREITSVLRRKDALVIPLLIGSTKMPDRNLLPSDLQPLTERQAPTIRFKEFKDDMRAVRDALLNHFQEAVGDELSPPPGIIHIEENFPESRMRSLVEQSFSIRIMHTWTSYVGRGQWYIVKALQQGAKLQLLLLNPFSPIAKERAKDSRENTQSEIIHTLEKIVALRADPTVSDKSNVQVKLYDHLPYSPVYICDEKIIVGYYPYGARSDFAPHIVIQGLNTEIGKYVDEQFEMIWSKATNVELDNLDAFLKTLSEQYTSLHP